NWVFFANLQPVAALINTEDITTAFLPGRFHSAQRTMAPLGTTSKSALHVTTNNANLVPS
ncbi:MAG: hypothetical protein B7Z21_00835, partial [Verrucomicrobiales bacterium 32-60-5]